MVPTIETARLILRLPQAADLPRQAAMLADPEVLRFLGARPHSREEAWRKLLGGAGLWALLGYGYWSVARKTDGLMIGTVGFADFKRAMTPSIEGLPEMGWLFASDAHGHGFASEAVAAALGWAAVALARQQFTAIIDPANAPSIRVAEKAGFSLREAASYNDKPILLFRRPAEA